MIFVDGVDIGDVADVALRDRRMLSSDGIFVVVATVSEQDGSSVAEPEIILRGVPYPDDAEKLLDEIRETVERSLDRAADEEIREIDLMQKMLHDDLAEFVYERLQAAPDGAAGDRRGLARPLAPRRRPAAPPATAADRLAPRRADRRRSGRRRPPRPRS